MIRANNIEIVPFRALRGDDGTTFNIWIDSLTRSSVDESETTWGMWFDKEPIVWIWLSIINTNFARGCNREIKIIFLSINKDTAVIKWNNNPLSFNKIAVIASEWGFSTISN